MLTIQLSCKHEPHRCRCRHNIQTEVNKDDLTNELIRHNPALLKYFGKRTVQSKPAFEKAANNEPIDNCKGKLQQPYRSIREEKGLNFILTDNYLDKKPKTPSNNLPKPEEPQRQNSNRQNEVEQRKVVSPRYQKVMQQKPKQQSKQKIKQNSREKDVKKYHKQMKNQSRYLSDTAFRKYFNRQCFQNYGRNNTNDKADGFAYGNYMKTFNINPHTGENMPINQQTFYHALVSGSPQKYKLYTQEVKLGMTQQNTHKIEKNSLSIQKQKFDVAKMLSDNEKHSKLQQKYDHIKLKSKPPASPSKLSNVKSYNIKNKTKSEKELKGPSHLEINTRKHFPVSSRGQNTENAISEQSNYASRKKDSLIDELKPNALSIVVQKQEKHQQNNTNRAHNTSKLNQRQSRKFQQRSPSNLNCNHSQQQQNVECASCLNKIKKMIFDLAESDPDLADRILTSAKKASMYKNYALNNYQNATMNPKNYRDVDGRLNVYQP